MVPWLFFSYHNHLSALVFQYESSVVWIIWKIVVLVLADSTLNSSNELELEQSNSKIDLTWPIFRRTTTPPEATTDITPSNSTTVVQSPERFQLNKLVCIDDYENAALRILDKNTRTYYSEGSDEETTLRENVLAYKRLTIKPRMLVDVSKRTLKTIIFGKEISFPFGVSPTAFQKLATPEGEVASAKAAAAMGIIFTLSSMSNVKIEDVAKMSPDGRKWMHLYIFKDRTITANLMRRAETNGFEAFVVTIDSPALGRHRENLRDPFVLPDNLTLANFGSEMGSVISNGTEGLYALDDLLDPSITWKDIRWLKSMTRLPVIVKGFMSPLDVELAISSQVDGIFVSNHGGRQLDTVPASIDILPEIVNAVKGRTLVLFDGGVRKGTDIFKALAYGADMVLAGRPLLWGLAVNGEQGATAVLQILKDEFNSTMALAGVQNAAQITTQFVARSVSPQPH